LFSLFWPNDFSAAASRRLVERSEGWPEIALRHRLAAVDAQPAWLVEQSEALLGAQKLGRWKIRRSRSSEDM